MPVNSKPLINEPSKAVFLSYASQDAGAARRIREGLSSAGIDVWFDQSELRGGDAWDQKIRRQIRECALFVPLISKHTQARAEGYFRLEWHLADQRTHLMGRNRAFLVPVCVDDTREADADAPDSFSAVQWTRLPDGSTPPAFIERVLRLLATEPVDPGTTVRPAATAASHEMASLRAPAPTSVSSQPKQWVWVLIAAAVIAVIGLGYLALDKGFLSRRTVGAESVLTATSLPGESVQSAIPEKSIAVLPFINMSADKEQDYFSDGLTEEMIELLGQVPDLRVPARTSSFYFKGKNETIASVAQQLKVAHVLEGSVRKAGKRLRITAQLIRADNGYHLWSQSYDRDDTDVFAVQDDIAKAVVSALEVKLAGGAQDTGSRGTTNAEAYNQYLLGRQQDRRDSLDGYRRAVDAYGKAIALDPNYAAAYAGLARAEGGVADNTGDSSGIDRAKHGADKAIEVAPNNAIGYAARSWLRTTFLWDWAGAQADIERALVLDPRNSDVQHQYARLLYCLSQVPAAIAAQKQATELDPLSSNAWENLGFYYLAVGDYARADAALGRAIEIEPTSVFALSNLGQLRLLEGKAQEALAAFRKIDFDIFQLRGVAMAEHSLGHSQASQQALDGMMEKYSKVAAFQIAEIFAWRGEQDKAFEWLERAYVQRDGGLFDMKSDIPLKSLRADARFKALLRKLRLPE